MQGLVKDGESTSSLNLATCLRGQAALLQHNQQPPAIKAEPAQLHHQITLHHMHQLGEYVMRSTHCQATAQEKKPLVTRQQASPPDLLTFIMLSFPIPSSSNTKLLVV